MYRARGQVSESLPRDEPNQPRSVSAKQPGPEALLFLRRRGDWRAWMGPGKLLTVHEASNWVLFEREDAVGTGVAEVRFIGSEVWSATGALQTHGESHSESHGTSAQAREAARVAFSRVRQAHLDQTLDAYALYSDSGAMRGRLGPMSSGAPAPSRVPIRDRLR